MTMPKYLYLVTIGYPLISLAPPGGLIPCLKYIIPDLLLFMTMLLLRIHSYILSRDARIYVWGPAMNISSAKKTLKKFCASSYLYSYNSAILNRKGEITEP